VVLKLSKARVGAITYNPSSHLFVLASSFSLHVPYPNLSTNNRRSELSYREREAEFSDVEFSFGDVMVPLCEVNVGSFSFRYFLTNAGTDVAAVSYGLIPSSCEG
jgi:hypothetical protein